MCTYNYTVCAMLVIVKLKVIPEHLFMHQKILIEKCEND